MKRNNGEHEMVKKGKTGSGRRMEGGDYKGGLEKNGGR